MRTKWIITKFSEVCVQSAGKWYEHRGVEGSCWMWNVLIDSVFNAFHSTLPSVRFGKKICQVRAGCFLVLAVRNATNYEIVGAAFHRTQWLSRKFVPWNPRSRRIFYAYARETAEHEQVIYLQVPQQDLVVTVKLEWIGCVEVKICTGPYYSESFVPA